MTPRRATLKATLGGLGVVLLLIGVVLAAPARAGGGGTLEITVTTTADTVAADGVTSLREAFDQANASSATTVIVHLQPGATYQLTRCLGGTDEDLNVGGDLDLTRAFTPGFELRGNGTTIRQTCAGERVIHMTTFTRLTLQGVTVTGGDTADSGGGVYVGANGLRLVRAGMVDNEAGGSGGGAYVTGGGAVPVVVESTISGNHAGGSGGGIFSNNVIALTRSTVSGNSAEGDGGGVYAVNQEVDGFESTLSGNQADGTGAAAYAPQISLVRSTVADNRALGTGGGSLRGTSQVFSAMSVVVPSTLAGSGLGCDTTGGAASGSSGYSYSTDSSCGFGSVGDVQDGADPDLGPLGANGGPTPTRLPNPGSALVGAVPAGFGGCIGADQRGVGRPQGGACEIGSVEVPLPFSDVGTGHPFFAEIMWMDANGISTGFDDGTYRPSASVTRQAMSAFMYRLAGEPAFTPPGTPTFTDVSTGHPFFAEIEWMADEGITNGFQPGPTYRPAIPVTRQAMSAFMYRLAGEPAFTPPGTPTFTDVSTGHPFFAEIEWMADEGITNGFQPGPTYRPGTNVSRQAMSAFMQRLDDTLA